MSEVTYVKPLIIIAIITALIFTHIIAYNMGAISVYREYEQRPVIRERICYMGVYDSTKRRNSFF